MNRPIIDPDLLPSEEDIAFYQEHGYYVSKKIFTDEEIDAALQGSERYYRGERDFPEKESAKVPGWKPEDGDVLRKNDYASLQNRELSALVRKPVLGAIASALVGEPVRLWHDQLLYKPIDNEKANVGWHTDRTYWQMCTSDKMLTAWIPFHDCFEEHGTITVIDGSHKWPDNTRDLDFWDPDLNGAVSKFNTGGREIQKVPLLLPKGHVSFHNCLTIHGSGPNRSSIPRRSLAVHIQNEANRYRDHYKENGDLEVHYNQVLCREANGLPDFTDPEICPRLWPVEAC